MRIVEAESCQEYARIPNNIEEAFREWERISDTNPNKDFVMFHDTDEEEAWLLKNGYLEYPED